MTTRSDSTAERGRRPWGPAVLGVLGLLLVVGAGFAWYGQAPPAKSAGPGQPPSASASVAPVAEATRARWVPGAPRRVVIPRLGVRAPVVPVKAPGGTLTPPSDPQVLGWWADGARPGAARGSALVTGHTVHTGGGALDDLETMRHGDRVSVRTDHGWIRYGVRSVHVYAKGTIARQAERLFSQDVVGRLVLITCEDWDGTRYLSNVVVVATPSRTQH
ncbi:class F sortase [Nocardioides sp. LS1]|uniref:class F sortase n=1 Tax=Nocardioides sp. LS1 TaxID=1027620 RepID=UPI000FF9400C|nr:class F sortase [Nocardioides sp. LS1]GCD89118.1 hypothetical protein NLS1_11240 [Nocardioides sp. LS1]